MTNGTKKQIQIKKPQSPTRLAKGSLDGIDGAIPKQHRIKLSVIIPTLNAADTLPETLMSLRSAERRGVDVDIIVVDASSNDGTRKLVEQFGAKFISSLKGRGLQLCEGVKMATGDWFLFLHADTILSPGWDASLVVFAAQKSNLDRAAVFSFSLNSMDRRARLIEKAVRFRNNWLGLPYGDQGLIIHRCFYSRLGGYKTWPIMEDVDIIRRIGMSRLALFDVEAKTSATRYERNGYFNRVIRNFLCLTLYFMRVSPNWISKLYN